MTLKLGLYLNVETSLPSFFVSIEPFRGMYVWTIGDALKEPTTSDAPPPCRQLSPINLIKWSN